MIEVFLFNLISEGGFVKAGQGKDIEIKVNGHAGFGSRNSDIVCAAVSAVIQTAVISITKVAGVHQKVRQKQGFLNSVIPINKLDAAALNKVYIIINSMLAGLEEIIKIHPEALKIYFDQRG
ncbi:MAG: ribosomal-processing cysteine protease Prp [Spirochaetes bacterium]|nr:ribosomal-processing cysteine protease Prp [Spirochaetota bacterium]